MRFTTDDLILIRKILAAAPGLRGSDKQVKWARDIRHTVIHECVSRLGDWMILDVTVDGLPVYGVFAESDLRQIVSIDEAGWWIRVARAFQQSPGDLLLFGRNRIQEREYVGYDY